MKKLVPIFLALLLLPACDNSLQVSFLTETSTALETDGIAEVVVTLNRSNQVGVSDTNAPDSSSSREIKVPYTITGGTAVPGVNYQLGNGTIVFPAGSQRARIKVPVLHHLQFEGDKTVTFALGEPDGASLQGITTHTLTIVEVDISPLVTFLTASQTVSEGAGTLQIPISLEYVSQMDATVGYTVSGTAVAGVDFTTSGTVTIPTGQTSGNVTVNLIDNFVIEPNRTLILTMTSFTGTGAGAITTHTITIADNDNLPTVFFASSGVAVGEASGVVTVNLSMNKTYTLDVEIPLIVTGTATSVSDHNMTNRTITIPAGSTSGSTTFNVVSDSLDEDDETVVISLGTIVNGNVGAPSTYTVTIMDDDPNPTVSFSASTQTVSESVGTVTVRANLSPVSGRTVTVPYTVSGTSANPADHNLSSGSITIAAGASNGTTTFTVQNDAVYEGNETVIVTMGVPTNATAGAPTTQTITITDDEVMPNVSFSVASQSLAEGATGSTSVVVNINLSSASAVSTTIPFNIGGTATSGTDFDSFTTSPVIIGPGSTTAQIDLAVYGDNMYENNETITLTLSAPTNATLGATTTHTVTITNDDPQPSVSFSASSQEVGENVPGGLVYVLFVLSNPSGFTVTVPYTVGGTATNPSDHNLSNGSTTITPGNTERVFTFSVVNDSVAEPNETVIMTIGAPTNATLGSPSVHTVTITDNDRRFDLDQVKLWLDAGEGIEKNLVGRIQKWSPRFLNPFETNWSEPVGALWLSTFWKRLPGVRGISFDWLEHPNHLDQAFTVYREVGEGGASSPQALNLPVSELPFWWRDGRKDLAEMLWTTDQTSKKDVIEIEKYLAEKYSVDWETFHTH